MDKYLRLLSQKGDRLGLTLIRPEYRHRFIWIGLLKFVPMRRTVLPVCLANSPFMSFL